MYEPLTKNLKLRQGLFQADAQLLQVSNFVNEMGRDLHLGKVAGALLQHQDGGLDACLTINHLTQSSMGPSNLKVGFSDGPAQYI